MPTTGVAVYSTNIDGIGYRINVQGVGFLPRTITTNSTTINGAVTDTYSIGMPSIQLSLVKTAPVTGNGLLSPGLYAIGYAGGNTAQQYIQVLVGNARVISPTCNVAPQSSNLVVDMDEVRRSWFTGVGNTQGSKAFDITVNCRVSANNQFNTVSDHGRHARPIQRAGVLKLAASGSTDATGIGIQVLNGAGQPCNSANPWSWDRPRTGITWRPSRPAITRPCPVTTGQANGMATLTQLQVARRHSMVVVAGGEARVVEHLDHFLDVVVAGSAARNPLPRCAPAAR